MNKFTSFKVYCNVCGVRFEMTPGSYWGRSEKCCSSICLNQMDIWNTRSIMGLSIEQEA